MKTLTKLMTGVALCTAVACATIAASGRDVVVIKMGTVISNRDGVFPHHMLRVERHMARLIEKNTNGEVILEVLESGAVPIRGMLDMVTSGEEIQAANINAFFFPKVPEMLIQSIPFLFTGAEHARRFATSEPADWMSAKIEAAYDVKVLGYLLVAIDVSFNGVKPVRMPSDFTGKIINGSRGTDSMFDGVKPKSIEHIGFSVAMSGGLVDSDIAYRRYNEALYAKILEAKAAGLGREQAMESIELPEFSHLGMYDKWIKNNISGMWMNIYERWRPIISLVTR